MTLLRWFRDLLARWFGSTRLQALRRGRVVIHWASPTTVGGHAPQQQRIAAIPDATVSGAVRALERLDARLPAGVAAAGILTGDRGFTLQLARSLLPGAEPAAGTPALAWRRQSPLDSMENDD